MYTYSQLISRNFLHSGILTVVIAAVILFFSLQQIQQQQFEQINSIEVIVNQTEKFDVKELGKKLIQAGNYSTLSIISTSKDILFDYSAETDLLTKYIVPSPTKVFNKNHGLTITFQLNTQYHLNILINEMIGLFLFTVSFFLISSWLHLQSYRKMIKEISIKIETELIDSPFKESNQKIENIKRTNLSFPELESCLAKVKSQISGSQSNTLLLEEHAYVDSLTGLENRNRFVEFFENPKETFKFGVLTITRCSELQTINKIHGYCEGDKYICYVANIMKSVGTQLQSAKLFRLNSSDFATFLPNTMLKDAEKYAQSISEQFNLYQQSSDFDSVGYTGMVYFDDNKPLGELLALADTAISIAQTQKLNAWFAQTDTTILEGSSANYGNQNWRQEIDSVLESQRLTLLTQQLKPNKLTSKVYSEVLARFLNTNGEMLPTASFIAMAEKLDKVVAVDRMVIEKVLLEIVNKNLVGQNFGINISARTIHDEHFLIWLERRLLRDPAIASNLVFEISEFGLQQNIKTSKRFIDMIHRVGSRITVERFGVGLTSFKFFRDLKPDFIKMDSMYTRDIDEDKNNQYFLRLMVDLAHRLSITVLAESVESQEEKSTLEKLFIDGCQGFYIGKPKPM